MQRDVRIEELKTLVALVECGSLASAAQILGRTESALSLQLRRLETAVGVPLLKRVGRRLALNTNGQIVLSHAKRMLKLQKELRDQVHSGLGEIIQYTPSPESENIQKTIAETIGVTYSDRPLRITTDADGELASIKPMRSFREQLPFALLRDAYDKWRQSALEELAIEFSEIIASSDRLTGSYAIEVYKNVREEPLLLSLKVGSGIGSRIEIKPSNRATNVSPNEQGRIEVYKSSALIGAPTYYSGACHICGYYLHLMESLILPCRDERGDVCILVISEISEDERYAMPSQVGNRIWVPEQVMLSIEDKTGLYPFINGLYVDIHGVQAEALSFA